VNKLVLYIHIENFIVDMFIRMEPNSLRWCHTMLLRSPDSTIKGNCRATLACREIMGEVQTQNIRWETSTLSTELPHILRSDPNQCKHEELTSIDGCRILWNWFKCIPPISMINCRSAAHTPELWYECEGYSHCSRSTHSSHPDFITRNKCLIYSLRPSGVNLSMPPRSW